MQYAPYERKDGNRLSGEWIRGKGDEAPSPISQKSAVFLAFSGWFFDHKNRVIFQVTRQTGQTPHIKKKNKFI